MTLERPSSSSSSSATLTVYAESRAVFPSRGSRDRLWTRTCERAQLSLISLPLPISKLHRTSRSVGPTPAKRTFAGAGLDDSTPPVSYPYDPHGNGNALGSGFGLGFGSRRPTRLFAGLRRSNSYNTYTSKRTNRGYSGRGMFSTPEERSASTSPSRFGSRGTSISPSRTVEPPSIAQIAMGLHTSRTPHLGPAHGFLLASDPDAGAGVRSASKSHLHTHPHAHVHAHAHGRDRARDRNRDRTSSVSPPPSQPQTGSSSTRVATSTRPLRSSLKPKNANTGANTEDGRRSASPSASANSVPSTTTTTTTRSTFGRLSAAISGTGAGTGASPRTSANANTNTNTNGGRSRLDKFLGLGRLGFTKSPSSPSSAGSLNSIGSGNSGNSGNSETELGTPRKAVRFVSLDLGGEEQTDGGSIAARETLTPAAR